MGRFSLIVFDLDGTLVDSRRDLADSINLLLSERGADPLPEAAIGRMIGDGAATLVARAFARLGRERPFDALERFLEIYNGRLLEHTRPYPGIPAALDGLRARAELCVLTNKPIASTRRVLEGLKLAQYFPADRVVGGDGPFARKPDPSGLRPDEWPGRRPGRPCSSATRHDWRARGTRHGRVAEYGWVRQVSAEELAATT